MYLIFVVIAAVAVNGIFAQLNGEFWWLNDKVTKLRGVEAPGAKFEDVGEFETDESDMIIFKDNKIYETHEPYTDVHVDTLLDKKNKSENFDESVFNLGFLNAESIQSNANTDIKNVSNTEESTQINPNINQSDFNNKSNIYQNFYNKTKNETYTDKIFFPGDTYERNTFNNVNFQEKANKIEEKDFNINYKLQSVQNYLKKPFKLNTSNLNSGTDVEYNIICTCISKEICIQRNGTVYKDLSRKNKVMGCHNKNTVCCIVPLLNNEKRSKIIFPTDEKFDPKIRPRIRHVRSTYNVPLKGQLQRNAILKKMFAKVKPIDSTTIVNPCHGHVDPYWNIKNDNLKTPNQKKNRPINTKYDYHDVVESDDDYALELPKPIITENPTRPYELTNSEEQYHSHGTSYGNNFYHTHTTVNPRIGNRVAIGIQSIKPTKNAVTSSCEDFHNAERQFVTYQTNADYQVLKDYKLINLIRDNNKIYHKDPQQSNDKVDCCRSTQPVSILPEEKPSYESSIEINNDEVDSVKHLPYENCGRAENYDPNGAEDEEVKFGSHPWLSLVVRTRRHTTLCSATIIHERAALTTASCVYGASAGEIVLRAGEWDLAVQPQGRIQRRLPSIYAHPQYQRNTLNYDLAILHWTKPLRLGISVQPACLSDITRNDTSCGFVGWGGQDQTIYARPNWQQAKLLSSRKCEDNIRRIGLLSDLPSDAFCVTTRGNKCVTDVGSSLLCSRNGRVTAMGVAIWRDQCDSSPVLILNVQEWTRHALKRLGIANL